MIILVIIRYTDIWIQKYHINNLQLINENPVELSIKVFQNNHSRKNSTGETELMATEQVVESPFCCNFHGGRHPWSHILSNFTGRPEEWRSDMAPSSGVGMTITWSMHNRKLVSEVQKSLWIPTGTECSSARLSHHLCK